MRRISRSTSSSERPRGRRSAWRTSFGTSANNSSTSLMPSSRSMASSSDAPERKCVILVRLQELAVRGGVHELLRVGGVRHLDLAEPALAVRVLVHQLGLVVQRLVHGDDPAA